MHTPLDYEGHSPLALLHRRWGRRQAAAGHAQSGELYSWGDVGCAGLGRAVNGSQSRTARAGRVETGERIVAVAAGKVRTRSAALAAPPPWPPRRPLLSC